MHDFLSTFNVWDLLIIAAYLVGVVWLGFKVGGKKKGTGAVEGKSTEEYVVGSRKIPWPAVVCSIVATEISAATFIGVPQAAFDGNLNYLQFGIGSLLARFAVASIFIGAFYYFGVLTVYEYLFKRFGPKSRYTATGFFLLGRVLGSGVRLYIATFALAGIFDIPMWVSLILFTLAAMAYTWFGGIKSVIWTGVMQAIVFVGGVIALVIYLQFSIGWGNILQVAGEAGKLELIHTTAKHPGIMGWLNDPTILYIAILNGFLATTSALGTDQDLTQRMLTCKDAGKARRSVIISGFVGLPITAMFLFVGIGLYVYFTTIHTGAEALPWAANGDTRLVLPYFIGHVLPHGLRGLLVAALFATAMSCVDSTLGALSSAAVVDLYKPFIAPGKSDEHYLKACRWAVLLFGILICAVAWYVRDNQEMLWLALQVAAIPGGALLGVFLLGLMTKDRGSDKGNMVAMLSSAAYSSVILYMSLHKWETFGWSWVIVLGALWTVSVGILLDRWGRKASSVSNCGAAEPSVCAPKE